MINQQLLEKFVSFRRELHMHPESSFNEYETRERIKKILKELGVQQSWWKEMAKTALVVDLTGQAEQQGERKCIAFRADMDALTMKQTNEHLQYKSKNEGVAHMCGHDGHMTCLISFVPLFLQKRDQIPKNKTIRLLFQPSEQGPVSGAELMIKEGCLQGVDQVYGFHNWPTAPLGELWCQPGPVMSQITIINIKITGTSGHASEPQIQKVAIWEAVNLYKNIKDYIDELKKQKKDKFVCVFPVLQIGQRFNVISQSAYMQGSIRSFENGLKDIITSKIQTFVDEIVQNGFKVDYHFNTNAPINENTQEQAHHVLRVGQKVFGKDKVGKGKLPIKASEDFAFFTKQRPGAFFFLSTARNEPSPPMLHNSNFNFNDELIPKAAQFWYELALDRLDVHNL